MSPKLKAFYAQLNDLPAFSELRPSHINDTNFEGENALHVAVLWNDIQAAKLLIAAGININQPGDLGYTPLHAACSGGKLEMVKLLVKNGADVHALSEGSPPFTIARLMKNDHVCEYLGRVMKKRQKEDPKIWVRARIKQLKAELRRLEKSL
jgi:ankyrin repeat protein